MPDPKPNRGLYRNRTSFVGAAVMLVATILIVFALISQATVAQPSAYVGIFTYLLFPALLLGGAGVVVWGMRRESVRRRREGTSDALPYPRLDLNEARQRHRFLLALAGGSAGAVLLTWLGYSSYQFTGSNTFCSAVCHTPMQPEATAYLRSPHANVPCVECHVGHSAGKYVESKVSGVRQVAAVALDSYDRPIRSPAHDMQPARDICQRCHWPRKFSAARLHQRPHFRYDEKNSPEEIRLVVKTGGGDSRLGRHTGIHWHMAIDNKVTFVATDELRQRIPWVSVQHSDGTVVEYLDPSAEISPTQLAALPRHELDCLDCHNRASHSFEPPEESVDLELAAGRLAADLPWIKKVAVEALLGDYPDHRSAAAGIHKAITRFYAANYPEIADERAGDIEAAVRACVELYKSSIFPEMRVDWGAYPDNIGHQHWPGCFRCHDEKHVTRDGRTLSQDCALCHSLPVRGAVAPLGELPSGERDNWHPWEPPAEHVDIEAHEDVQCYECHTAGARPRRECADCHQ